MPRISMRPIVLSVLAIVSLVGLLCFAALWAYRDGQLYTRFNQGRQHNVLVVQRQLVYTTIDYVWPPTTERTLPVIGNRIVFRIPLWPCLIACAVFPSWWLIAQLRHRRRHHGVGFEVHVKQRQ